MDVGEVPPKKGKLKKFDALELIEFGLSPSEQAAFKQQREANVTMICLLVAMGEPADAVAMKLDLARSFVDGVVNSEDGVNKVIKMQSALCPEPAQRVKKMANRALDVMYKLMHTADSDSVKKSAATDILDRSGGKAVAVTENRNFTFDAGDMSTIDQKIAAQNEKLARLDRIERRLKKVDPVPA